MMLVGANFLASAQQTGGHLDKMRNLAEKDAAAVGTVTCPDANIEAQSTKPADDTYRDMPESSQHKEQKFIINEGNMCQ